MWVHMNGLTSLGTFSLVRLVSYPLFLGIALYATIKSAKSSKKHSETSKSVLPAAKESPTSLAKTSDSSNGEAIPDAFFSHFMAEWRDHVQPFDRK